MDTTITKTNPLGTERIGKLVLTFAVPSIISMVVNALYNIVDQIFIGQGVGYLGNGATNVVMPMTVIAIALSLLIGDGAAAYLSLKLGEGDEESAAREHRMLYFGHGSGGHCPLRAVQPVSGTVMQAVWRDRRHPALRHGLWTDHFLWDPVLFH